MLLMERSAERYPYITSVIMEFLKNSVDEYFPPLKEYMAQCVACGMRVLLGKGVIRSLMPIYKCPSTEPATKEYMLALFGEFLGDDAAAATHALPTPSMPTTHQAAVPSVAGTPKNDGYLTEEELEEGEEPPVTHNVEEDDVDEYLYGESDSNVKYVSKANEAEVEEDDDDDSMDDNPLSTLSIPLTNDEDMDDMDASVKEGSAAPRSIQGDDPEDLEQMATDDDYEDEAEPSENIQSNQSYWIFGDSLKRFKEASANVNAAQKEGDQNQYEAQLHIAKKSLKEILAVFLRMAIPAETLVPTIGPYVRNMVASNMLSHTSKAENLNDLDSVLEDPSKDVFDLITATFWSVRDNDASRDKLVRLIGCISHTKKNKGRRHAIGMRWWAFIAS